MRLFHKEEINTKVVKVAVIGSGQFATGLKELIQLLPDFEFAGYIGLKKNRDIKFTDKDTNKLKGNNIYALALGIGNLSYPWLEKIIERYEKKGFKFPTLIHPSAVVSPSAKLEKGVIVLENSVIKNLCKIKKMTVINTLSLISHGCVIGKYCYISPGVTMAAQVVMGKNSFCGINSSIIHGGIKIGKNAFIGAQSLIVNNVPSNAKIFGLPAKIIGKNFPKK